MKQHGRQTRLIFNQIYSLFIYTISHCRLRVRHITGSAVPWSSLVSNFYLPTKTKSFVFSNRTFSKIIYLLPSLTKKSPALKAYVKRYAIVEKLQNKDSCVKFADT